MTYFRTTWPRWVLRLLGVRRWVVFTASETLAVFGKTEPPKIEGEMYRDESWIGHKKSTARKKARVVRFGKKALILRRGNFVNRSIVPFIERGPFGCFTLSWKWGQIGWELSRWL